MSEQLSNEQLDRLEAIVRADYDCSEKEYYALIAQARRANEMEAECHAIGVAAHKFIASFDTTGKIGDVFTVTPEAVIEFSATFSPIITAATALAHSAPVTEAVLPPTFRCSVCDSDCDPDEMMVKRDGLIFCQSCVENGELDVHAERAEAEQAAPATDAPSPPGVPEDAAKGLNPAAIPALVEAAEVVLNDVIHTYDIRDADYTDDMVIRVTLSISALRRLDEALTCALPAPEAQS